MIEDGECLQSVACGLEVDATVFKQAGEGEDVADVVLGEEDAAAFEIRVAVGAFFEHLLFFRGQLGDDDPFQRVKMIHDIVHSISLIPDTISRSIYANEISERFDIDINTINQQLAKLRTATASKQRVEPDPFEYAPKPKPTQSQTKALSPKDTSDTNLQAAEYNLIRILVKYGVFAVELDSYEEGSEQKIETSVAELICHELSRDNLDFVNPIYNEISFATKIKKSSKPHLKLN